MADDSNLTEDATKGLSSLFGRLGEFFHIFDLSFLVSGATTLGALAILGARLGLTVDLPIGWILGFALIIAAYVCGLISFALGRLLNGMLFRRSALAHFESALIGQNLQGSIIAKYLQSGASGGYPLWRLYIRLWQHLAAKQPTSVAFHHLSRYWAMAATYDGVAISLTLWAAAITPIPLFGRSFLTPSLTLVAMAVLLGAAIACLRQGAKYYEFQVEDLVAALAVVNSRVD
jgi:hypothetical protein